MRTIAPLTPSRVVLGAAALLVLAATACGESPPPNAYMTTPGGGGSYARGSLSLGEARLRPEVCSGMAENKPDWTRLDENALVQFLQRQGLQTTVIRARADLVYVDVTNSGGDRPVRLRVAVLNDAPAAGADLHKAILEHGSGSWGVHRSNLAVLGPIGDVDQILAFAGKSKLACWGVLTVAGLDDDFVVPGGYMEF
jgi:hypothetical protein